ncbi:MAG: cadherin-like beta sandwich domain-containing protein, partial [Akkermansiaceae bacterium]|nr:cadherin-like beta sandwich domain-containing protein [Akkermansiaceae bacterium]
MTGKTILATATGNSHSLALCADGSLFAWGHNDYGQFGDGTTTDRLTPVPVPLTGALAGKTVVAISAGYSHSLALCADGSLCSWGSNEYGQLGAADFQYFSAVPVPVQQSGVLAGKRIAAIFAGGSFNLVRCTDGTLAAWGIGAQGQLGNGSTTHSNVPVLVDQGGVLAGKRVLAVAPGANHTLVLCSDGTLAAWGYNNSGQLGDGTTTFSKVPVLVNRSGVLAGKTVDRIAAGGSHNLVRCTDGTLASWGYGYYGQLGNGTSYGSSSSPVLVSSGALAGKTVTGIVAGDSHSFALGADGTLAGWGDNQSGAVGNNSYNNATTPVAASLAALQSGETLFKVVSGNSAGHSIAIIGSPLAPLAETLAATGVSDTTATLRGNASGNGSQASVSFEYGLDTNYGTTAAAMPATVSGNTATAVAAALTGLLPGTTYHFRTVASGAGGTVRGGDRTFTTGSASSLAGLVASQGTLTPAFSPTVFDYHLTVPAEAASILFTPTASDPAAAIRLDTTAVPSGTATAALPLSAGVNAFAITVTAATGPDTLTYRIAVVRLPELFDLPSPTSIPLTAPGLLANGREIQIKLSHAPATGASLMLVNNTGTAPISGTFANLPQGGAVGLPFGGVVYPFVANYYGGSGNDLVLQWANTWFTGWGYNQFGQTGDGGTASRLTPYEPKPTARPVIAVTCGELSNVLLGADGAGLTGNGVSWPNPPGVLAGRQVVMIATGLNHTLGLCSDGALGAWGVNGNGELGNGSTSGSSSPPVWVSREGVLAGRTITAISAGSTHSLALCSDGTVAAWGANTYGQLGNNSTTTATVPVLVDRTGVLAGKTVVAIAAGREHSLALCADGTLASWGGNSTSQLGDGTTTNSLRPVPVSRSGVLATRTATSIFAGGFHSGALCSDGSIATWGNNSSGQLGNGTTNNSSVPVLVTRSGVLSGKTVTAVDGAENGTLATCSDGTLASWGDNWYGQAGDGGDPYSGRTTPVLVSTSSLLSSQRFIRGYAGP